MDVTKFILFTLVFARVGGLTLTAPIYGASHVPLRIRIFLMAVLTLLILPAEWNVTTECPADTIQYAVLLGSEALIGASLGLGILILIHGMSLAGALVAQASGLTVADVFDPMMDENVPLFSQLLFLVSVAVFLCLGGHRMVMAGLLDTFRTIPPGSGRVPGSLGDMFVTLVTQSFSLGIRAAAPAVTALLLATLILGLVSRTLPQLNILSLGFGVNALLAFAALGLTLGAAVWAFQDQIQPAMETILDALHTPMRTQWML
jgi:flagellar biosynthetic protein FliR